MVNYDLLIFDLDGTLLDTSQGIFNSVRYAEEHMGFNAVEDSVLRQFVGPPPKLIYQKVYNVSEEIALEATKKHREYAKTKAICEAKPYPKVRETLSRLKNSGYKLAVATLKSQTIAETVLRVNGLYDLFDVIVGMDEKESLTKCETILLVLEKIGKQEKALMIGDSLFDFEGAIEAKVDFVGVLYGFGFQEGQRYKFDTIVKFEDLYEYLMR
ncbi:HAD-IA family hydrolase [[Ruminococcus] torques]|uniref:HAD-IA family hydrolase n=1 Tax=[Ruminococcus] torques TaxID=33039 RepID=UPI0025A41D21|nr:HAD-IA family hydrolase [[Ruminococcus] torques]MDM8236966.1 HAD-IA family hydrolase [[Ruminococcus] torques]